MPKAPKRKQFVNEAVMEAAIRDHKAGKFTNHSKAAEAYSLEPNTLQRRIRGITLPKSIAHKPQRLFTDAEELAIVDWIGNLIAKDWPPIYDLITAQLNAVLHKKSPEADPFGKNFTYRFVECYSKL